MSEGTGRTLLLPDKEVELGAEIKVRLVVARLVAAEVEEDVDVDEDDKVDDETKGRAEDPISRGRMGELGPMAFWLFLSLAFLIARLWPTHYQFDANMSEMPFATQPSLCISGHTTSTKPFTALSLSSCCKITRPGLFGPLSHSVSRLDSSWSVVMPEVSEQALPPPSVKHLSHLSHNGI